MSFWRIRFLAPPLTTYLSRFHLWSLLDMQEEIYAIVRSAWSSRRLHTGATQVRKSSPRWREESFCADLLDSWKSVVFLVLATASLQRRQFFRSIFIVLVHTYIDQWVQDSRFATHLHHDTSPKYSTSINLSSRVGPAPIDNTLRRFVPCFALSLQPIEALRACSHYNTRGKLFKPKKIKNKNKNRKIRKLRDELKIRYIKTGMIIPDWKYLRLIIERDKSDIDYKKKLRTRPPPLPLPFPSPSSHHFERWQKELLPVLNELRDE